MSKGGNHENHVAELFHWHLVVLGHLAAAIELPVGQRNTEIVRREGNFPIRALGITHDWFKLSLNQFGVEKQKHGRRGIKNIDR